MRPLIEFCLSNLANGSHDAMEELQRDPNVDTVEYGCLNHCGLCTNEHFALVIGEAITGDTPKELVNNSYKYIDENEEL